MNYLIEKTIRVLKVLFISTSIVGLPTRQEKINDKLCYIYNLYLEDIDDHYIIYFDLSMPKEKALFEFYYRYNNENRFNIEYCYNNKTNRIDIPILFQTEIDRIKIGDEEYDYYIEFDAYNLEKVKFEGNEVVLPLSGIKTLSNNFSYYGQEDLTIRVNDNVLFNQKVAFKDIISFSGIHDAIPYLKGYLLLEENLVSYPYPKEEGYYKIPIGFYLDDGVIDIKYLDPLYVDLKTNEVTFTRLTNKVESNYIYFRKDISKIESKMKLDLTYYGIHENHFGYWFDVKLKNQIIYPGDLFSFK